MKWFVLFFGGLIAGLINAVAGGASAITFPLLLGLGLPPISATTTNAVGISSANFFALIPRRKQLVKLFDDYKMLILYSSVATSIGAWCLLAFPARVFEKIAPFLLMIASVSLLIPLNRGKAVLSRAKESCAIAFSGFYCGYFGPGQGVIVFATLMRSRSHRDLNAGKNLIVAITNIFSNTIYIFSGVIDWPSFSILFISSGIGGLLSGKIAHQAPVQFFRILVFVIGFSASIWLFIKYLF